MNVIINGGSNGIGKELAIHMAGDISNTIIVTGRNIEALKSLTDRFSNIYMVPIDLSDFETGKKKFETGITDVFKSIDILINMAGCLISSDFLLTTEADARKIMETNFFGPASVIRLLHPFLSRGSHIVNITSMGGFQGASKYKGLSYYSASKAALACLTECLAIEFQGSDISVNCLALGAVQTEMLAEAFPGYKAPVDAKKMAEFINMFAISGNKFFNGKILPVALSNP
jgi:3-oxoacyl-[acyl-carrier protein] reductase